MKSVFEYKTRVYYEDTDAAGIVYYANYLKFAERARTEWLRGLGIEQDKLMREQGVGFVVKRVECDYISPARLDDLLTIGSTVQDVRKVGLTMEQRVLRGEVLLAKLRVDIVCVDARAKPKALPEKLNQLIQT
jgi:acyl-CoA thioester hydrolase